CIVLCMQAPTSTDARSFAAASCREKNPVSRGEHVGSNKRSGRLCCWISILATLPGTNSWAISDSSMITAPGARKTIEGPFERAQYEADLAGRRYKAVDPDNRLVARSLEREWNEKLAEGEKLEREYALGPKQAALSLTASQREQIRHLSDDLPAVFHAPTTTFAQRKQLF